MRVLFLELNLLIVVVAQLMGRGCCCEIRMAGSQRWAGDDECGDGLDRRPKSFVSYRDHTQKRRTLLDCWTGWERRSRKADRAVNGPAS